MENLPVEFQNTLIGIAEGSIAELDIPSIRHLFSYDFIKFEFKVGWILTHKGNEYLNHLGKYNSEPLLIRKFRALNS